MLKVHLEAKNLSLNISRVYYMDLEQDLFQDWILKTTYGRLGSAAQTKLYVFKTMEDSFPKIKAILSKRASAPRRLGCPYQLIHFSQDSSLLPLNFLKFFQKPFQASVPKPLKKMSKSKESISLPLFDH